jgi:uncharacterized membrane protein
MDTLGALLLADTDRVFSNFSQRVLDFLTHMDSYIIYMVWALIVLGVFAVVWAFFQRVNHEMKTSAFISRIFLSFLSFYAAWLITKVLQISLF